MTEESEISNPYSSPSVAATVISDGRAVELDRYGTVRRGLQFIYYSVAAIALSAIAFVPFSMFAASSIRPGSGGASDVLVFFPMLIFSIVIFVAAVVMFVGFCMCVACPKPDERTSAFITIGAFLLSFGVGLLTNFLPFEAGAFLTLAGQLLNIISTVAFCILIRRIGKNVSSEPMIKQSTRALIWYAIMMGFFLVVMAAGVLGFREQAFFGNQDTLLLVVFGLALVVLSLGTFFQFLSMIRIGIVELKSQQ